MRTPDLMTWRQRFRVTVICSFAFAFPLAAAGQVVREIRLVEVDGSAGSAIVPLEKVAPKYKELAWKARVGGTVSVEASLDGDGFVEGTRVLKGLPMGLDSAVTEAIDLWRFPPGRRHRRVHVVVDFVAGTAPTNEESSSAEGLRAWLVRVQGLGDLLAKGFRCSAFAEFEEASRKFDAGNGYAAAIFREFVHSEVEAVALVSRLRLEQPAGESRRVTLREMLRSGFECARCVASEELQELLRQSASELDRGTTHGLTLALGDAGIAGRLMNATVYGDFAAAQVGNGSDHVWGQAYFHRIDGIWRAVCNY